MGTRIIKELGDYYRYFKHTNDEDDYCILKKCFKEVKYIKPTPCSYLPNFRPCLKYNLGLACSKNKIGLVIFDKLILRWLQEADKNNDSTIRAYWKPYEIRDIKKEYGERGFNTFYS